ncbi:MAG TPA: hypothetical protein VG722_01685 [Tepidisphaeraceae bacterium]|nr:hypothetical protein [Tepidisphaeraceae bacterium]
MWFKKDKPSRSANQTVPVITAATRTEAKKNPNGWVYAIHGVADTTGNVPQERICGAWKVNEHGEIVGDFIPNPNYRSER